MRYAEGHKDAVRIEILAHAAKRMRAKGMAAVSLSDAMKSAGLTIGGFYGHFRAKRDLVREALGASLREGFARWFEGLSDLRGEPLEAAIVRRYLSQAHRDDAENRCVIPAAVSTLPSEAPSLRAELTARLGEYMEFMEPRVTGATCTDRRRRALAILATCVGGLALATSVSDPDLSEEILRAAREPFSRTTR